MIVGGFLIWVAGKKKKIRDIDSVLPNVEVH